MWPVAIVITTTLIAIALRRTRYASPSLLASRIAYGLLVLTPLVYFPARAGLRTARWSCQWTFDTALAVHSLTNYRHIILFAIFFLLTYAQLPGVRRAMWWSMGACIAMGLFVELAQGATGAGTLPDAGHDSRHGRGAHRCGARRGGPELRRDDASSYSPMML